MKKRFHNNRVSANGFSPKTNRMVGSFVYRVLFLIVLVISYKIWGVQVLTEIGFWIMYLFSYWFIGFLLRTVGFWVY